MFSAQLQRIQQCPLPHFSCRNFNSRLTGCGQPDPVVGCTARNNASHIDGDFPPCKFKHSAKEARLKAYLKFLLACKTWLPALSRPKSCCNVPPNTAPEADSSSPSRKAISSMMRSLRANRGCQNKTRLSVLGGQSLYLLRSSVQ